MSTTRLLAVPSAFALLAAPIAAAESFTGTIPAPVEHVLGRFHVLLVHFPLALIVMAGVFALSAGARRGDQPSPTSFHCLWAGALGALLSVGAGWLYAHHDPVSARVESDLFWHRWVGVAATAAAWISVILYALRRRSASPSLVTGSRTFLALAVILVGGAGHLGGDLAYGEGWVFAPLEAARAESGETAIDEDTVDAEEPAPPAEPAEEPVVEAAEADDEPPAPVEPVGELAPVDLIDYAVQIEPIFEAHCMSCHGARRQKGQLRLDQGAAMFDVEPRWWVVRPGDADASLLVQLMELPRDDLDAMPPPEEETAPTADEIALVRAWVDQGAPIDGVVHEWPEDAGG